jgi:hypothetical protein
MSASLLTQHLEDRLQPWNRHRCIFMRTAQAMAVHSAVLKGWKEMPEMTHADTLGMARTFDTIRAQTAARAADATTAEQVRLCCTCSCYTSSP